MMLPIDNPKSPKRRHHQRRLRDLASPKTVAISLFMVLNVGWFIYTTLLSSPRHRSGPRPSRPSGLWDDPRGPAWSSSSSPSSGGAQQQGAEGHRAAFGSAGPAAFTDGEGGGLFQPRGGSNNNNNNHHPHHHQQPGEPGGALEDLVVKGSVTSGDLKMTGNILSSSSGKLLVSAGVVGVGTSMLDAEHDKLVVNGPIRLTDAGARPSCEAARRGMIWHDFGEVGQADAVDVCAKGRDDAYAWRPVVGGEGRPQASAGAAASSYSYSPLAAAGGGGGGAALVRDFRVAPGSDLRAGDVVTFVEGHAKRGPTAQLGAPALFSPPGQAEGGAGKRRTALLALGRDLCLIVHSAGAAARVAAQVAKVRGTAAELAARQPLGQHRAEHVELAALAPREFVMVYNEPTERNAGYAVLGSVVGSAPRLTSQPLAIEPAGCASLAVAALSPALVVIAFNAGTANGPGTPTVLAASVADDGRRLVLGNRTHVAGGRMDGFVVVPMSISTFVLVHRNVRQKGAGARVGRVGMVPQEVEAPQEEEEDDPEGPRARASEAGEMVPKAFVGDDVPLFSSSRALTYLAAARLSPWRIAVAYADGSEGNVLLAGVVGDTLTPQPSAAFSSAKPLSLSLSALSDDDFILSFYTHDPWRAVVVKGSMQLQHHQDRAGAGLALLETVVTTDYTTHTHSLALSPQSFLVTYYDGANSDAGTAVVGVFGRGMGVAAAAAAEGEMVPVRFGGVSGGHESLEVGSCYYANDEGRVTTFVSELRVGLAISLSEILMGGC